MKKTLYALLICTTLTVSLPALSVNILAAPAEPVADTSVETTPDVLARNPITEWRYKVIDGKLYKRLYDTTNKKWLTDWIPC